MDYAGFPQFQQNPNPNPNTDLVLWHTPNFSAEYSQDLNSNPYQPQSIDPQAAFVPPPGVDPAFWQPSVLVKYTDEPVGFDPQQSAGAPQVPYYPDLNATGPAGVSELGEGSHSVGVATTNPAIPSKKRSGKRKGSKKAKVVQPAWCEFCKVDCNSQEVLEQHKLGKKHKKNIEKLTLVAPTSPAAVAAPPAASPAVVATPAAVTAPTACVTPPSVGVTPPTAGMTVPPATVAAPPTAVAAPPAAVAAPPAAVTVSPACVTAPTAGVTAPAAAVTAPTAGVTAPSAGVTPTTAGMTVPPAAVAVPPAAMATSSAIAAVSPAASTPLPVSALAPTDGPIIGPEENPNKSKASGSSRSQKRAAARSEDLEAKRRKVLEGGAAAEAVRACNICNVVCNSDTVFNFHLAGQKHASMVKKHASGAGVASAM